MRRDQSLIHGQQRCGDEQPARIPLAEVLLNSPLPKPWRSCPAMVDRLGRHHGELPAAPRPRVLLLIWAPPVSVSRPTRTSRLPALPRLPGGPRLDQAIIHGQQRRGDEQPARIPVATEVLLNSPLRKPWLSCPVMVDRLGRHHGQLPAAPRALRVPLLIWAPPVSVSRPTSHLDVSAIALS